jgi:hypothetical protein
VIDFARLLKNNIMKTKQIAKTAHAVHLAYCELNDLSTQPKWGKLTREHKQTIKSTVKKILSGEIESVKNAHENFVEFKKSNGWVYGKTYDRDKKINPRLCDYEKLSHHDKVKETLFFECVNSFKS